MEKIYFRPLNGLGDKLLDTIGFFVLCKVLGYCPYARLNSDVRDFQWGNNLYDEQFFVFSGMDMNMSIDVCSKCVKYIDSYDPSVSLSPYKIYKYLCSNTYYSDSFEKFSSYYASCAKELIAPSKLITDHLPNELKNAYGIHLRKTDKVNDNHCVPHENSISEFDIIISALLEKVQNIIDKEDNPLFLVVSEDPIWKVEIEQRISETMKGHIIQLDYSVDMNNYTSVLDMFALSKCKAILQGVKYSTFSILAALLGNNNLINFSNYLPDDKECLIYAWNSVININSIKNMDLETYKYITRGSVDFTIASFVDFTELRSSARTTSMNDLGFSMPLRSASFACNLEPPMVVLKGSEKPSIWVLRSSHFSFWSV